MPVRSVLVMEGLITIPPRYPIAVPRPWIERFRISEAGWRGLQRAESHHGVQLCYGHPHIITVLPSSDNHTSQHSVTHARRLTTLAGQ